MKPKKQTYNLYQIDWKDAMAGGGWKSTKDYKPMLITVHSVGWLLAETKEALVLAQQMSSAGNAADTINIPKNCILRKYKLPNQFNVEYTNE